jgi:hypothetical protein
MTNEKFIDPFDHEEARKKAAAIADKERELSFNENERNSQEANKLWLLVFWTQFHAMVRP